MKFHSPTNPSFSLRTSRLSVQFSDGFYETKDPAEIRALKRCPHVEVAKKRPRKSKPAPKPERKVEPTASERAAGETTGKGQVFGPPE